MSGYKITEMYAFIAVDPIDGDEGLTSFHASSGNWPMVAADKARVDSLRPVAQELADASGVEIKLVKFSVREELETITRG